MWIIPGTDSVLGHKQANEQCFFFILVCAFCKISHSNEPLLNLNSRFAPNRSDLLKTGNSANIFICVCN